jgi:hypothetical protein
MNVVEDDASQKSGAMQSCGGAHAGNEWGACALFAMIRAVSPQAPMQSCETL